LLLLTAGKAYTPGSLMRLKNDPSNVNISCTKLPLHPAAASPCCCSLYTWIADVVEERSQQCENQLHQAATASGSCCALLLQPTHLDR
jgi:hypothetical protein